MKKLKVNAKNYALFEYELYHDRNVKVIPKPKKLTYELGQVVYMKEDNSLGVVIGCISEESHELRTDMNGMQCWEQIEPATKKHFEISGVNYTPRLYNDIMTKKYTSDGEFSVFAGKIEIARSYVGNACPEVRILQGMNRSKTIQKICWDCPEFAKANEITEKYYPYLFSASKKQKK